MFYSDAGTNSVRSLSRPAHRGRTGVRPEGAAEGAGLHAVRRAQRHRLRHARARNSGNAHASDRPPDEGAAQGHGYDLRQCGECRTWSSAAGRSGRWRRICAGSAHCCFATGRWKKTGIAAGVLNHPANGVAWLANRLALHDEQPRRGRSGVGRILYAPGRDQQGRHVSRRLRVGSDRSPASSSEKISIKTRCANGTTQRAHPYRRVQARQPNSRMRAGSAIC